MENWRIIFGLRIALIILLLLLFSHSVVSDSSAIPWTVAHQAPLSIGFSRQEYWYGLPFPSPGDLPDPWIESVSLTFPELAGGFFTTKSPGKPLNNSTSNLNPKSRDLSSFSWTTSTVFWAVQIFNGFHPFTGPITDRETILKYKVDSHSLV